MESLNGPPPHISSRTWLPESMRAELEGRSVRSAPASGSATMPRSLMIANGNSPLRWVVPRNFRICIVRRAASSSRMLRSTMTSSATNSSTPQRDTSPYSSRRSTVMTAVTPSSRRPCESRRSSRRTRAASGNSLNTAPSESSATRLAPIAVTARSIRDIRAPRSQAPASVTSCRGSGEASTNRHLPCASQAAMSHPSEMRLRRMSTGGSSKVMNTPGSSNCWMPQARYCEENSVFADPAVPLTSVVRPSGRPPWAIRSKPAMPVGTFSTGVTAMRGPRRRRPDAPSRRRVSGWVAAGRER
jgi:hypothetical protein